MRPHLLCWTGGSQSEEEEEEEGGLGWWGGCVAAVVVGDTLIQSAGGQWCAGSAEHYKPKTTLSTSLQAQQTDIKFNTTYTCTSKLKKLQRSKSRC